MTLQCRANRNDTHIEYSKLVILYTLCEEYDHYPSDCGSQLALQIIERPCLGLAYMQHNVPISLFSQLTLNMATRVLYVTYEINTTCFSLKNKSTNIFLISAGVPYNKAAFRMMFKLFNQFKILLDSYPFLAFSHGHVPPIRPKFY